MNAKPWIASAILAVSAACFAQSDSLGDLARQQRSTARPKARRVVTDDNLPKASPSEAMNGAVLQPKPPEVKTEEKPAPADSKDKPATPADAQRRIDELKAREEAQQRAVKKFEEELKDESVGADRRQLFEEGLANAKELLAESTQEREKIEKTLPDTTSNPEAGKGESTAASESRNSADASNSVAPK